METTNSASATPTVEPNVYELKFRILGNEVFAVALVSSSDGNRWTAIGLVSIFVLLTVIGTYGNNFVQLYHTLIH